MVSRVGGCRDTVKVLVVKSSDLAKILSEPIEGDETLAKFGKIFEEEYTLANHIYVRKNYSQTPKLFIKKVASRLKSEGIYSKELVIKAYRAYSALLNAGVVGKKPETTFRHYADTIFVAAQPDLYNEAENIYYEFKLYPINNYAKTQARIFAWVLEKPIILVGLREDVNGYLTTEREVLTPPDSLNVSTEELRLIAKPEVFCTKLMKPLKYCSDEV
ncbi:MAG: hypothetical protein RMH77_06925 [Sulfolobales archaeon]|nr:hypothetical protein [Sulfolobales archaeon]MCX8185793.1 hypothetical protein [Sulfolobales archaeon]MDW7970111.1 hypothetical protein [Sulfolobales archaeon]